MPRISVVVPIYNVEDYLAASLDSVAGQTVDDLEVVMVNDGATDGSRAIAAAYAERDPRFRLVDRPNGGLSAARNTGIDAATGEFLAFLDSDDVLPPNAYELLVGALDRTGSDFATGNVHRLAGSETFQARFLARTFARTQLATHVTRFRPLLADRVVWNKLWRRAFWDAQGYRFAEGRTYEDTPITVPAQFAARSVDVISEPVYLWRIRERGDLSITQQRLNPRSLLDRLTSVTEASLHLAEHGPRRAKRWYDESLVADDLRLFLNVLDRADDEYRQLFLDRVNAFLDGASPRIYEPLPAIERLKWQLVRRRLLPELLEVLRFQQQDLGATPPVRVGRHWYGDYPFRDDPRLRIPRSVYQLRDADLPGVAHLETLERDGDDLRIGGFVYVSGIGAPAPGSQRVRVDALRPGRLRRVRLRLAPLRLRTASVQRPDATARTGQALADLSWSGFEATLRPRSLLRRARGLEGPWEVYVTVSAGGIRRRRARFAIDPARPPRAVELPAGERAVLRAAPTEEAGLDVEVHRRWCTVTAVTPGDGNTLALSGTFGGEPPASAKLELRRGADGAVRRFPLSIEPAGFRVAVALDALTDAGPPPAGETPDDTDTAALWQLAVRGGGRRAAVLLADGVADTSWPSSAADASLVRTPQGDPALALRPRRAVVAAASWDAEGNLALSGTPAGGATAELVLRRDEDGSEHAFVLQAGAGRFSAEVAAGRVESLAGTLPLGEGTWRLGTRAGAAADLDPVMVGRELLARLPLERTVDHKAFALSATAGGQAVLVAERDLGADERGPYLQRRLHARAYLPGREQPLRDAVVYLGYGGRRCADSPRALHAELVRRGAPLEHLWVVRDGACAPPLGAQALRKGSSDYYEALARARYVVTNDHLPEWFRGRAGQVCVQTLQGAPLRRQGFDLADDPRRARRLLHRLEEEVANWDFLLSPAAYATPILRGAYGLDGEVIETGLPRADLVAGPELDQRRGEVRARLGLSEDSRVVLYAPALRPSAAARGGRVGLELPCDLGLLAAAAGDGATLLFRRHPAITDAAPVRGRRVRDVSGYPDATELLAAVDVLVTDYSSVMVDFAATGRPILCFAYDLEDYEESTHGFYFDYSQTVPGPVLRSAGEVAEALREPAAARDAAAGRYDAFVERFCALDDGHASERVVDRVFAA